MHLEVLDRMTAAAATAEQTRELLRKYRENL